MSLGGYIAQMIALDHPERVTSLVLMSAEPPGWDGPQLPHMNQDVLDHFTKLASLDRTDRGAVGAFLLHLERLSAAGVDSFDAPAARARIEKILDRTESPTSMFNHATLDVRRDWTGRFKDIA